MARTIILINQFKKSYKKLKEQNKNINKLQDVVKLLANDIVLPISFKDHKLVNSNKYKNCRECHIEPDLLLVYKKTKDKLYLILVDAGSHSSLFK